MGPDQGMESGLGAVVALAVGVTLACFMVGSELGAALTLALACDGDGRRRLLQRLNWSSQSVLNWVCHSFHYWANLSEKCAGSVSMGAQQLQALVRENTSTEIHFR